MNVQKRFKSFLLPGLTGRYLARVAAVALLAWSFFSFVCIPIHIEGGSMEPGYGDGGWNFIWRPAYLFSGPERGDVVAVRFSGRSVMLLKRVVALEGEEVEFRRGELFVDGSRVEEPYLSYRGSWDLSPRKVEKGNIYLVGDNRAMSMKNHTFGQTSIDRIVGVPIF